MSESLGTTQAGVREEMTWDDEIKGIHVKSSQDIQPFLDANAKMRNDGTHGWSKSRELKRIASIPPIIIQIWNQQYGVNVLAKENEPLFRRLLNDPDNKFLRTDK